MTDNAYHQVNILKSCTWWHRKKIVSMYGEKEQGKLPLTDKVCWFNLYILLLLLDLRQFFWGNKVKLEIQF